MTTGMMPAEAASSRTVSAEIGWSMPSILAAPSWPVSVSRSVRTTTVVEAATPDSAHPSVCRHRSASASARNWPMVRVSCRSGSVQLHDASTAAASAAGTGRPSTSMLTCSQTDRTCPDPYASRALRNSALTIASTAVLMAAPLTGSNRPLSTTDPSASSVMDTNRPRRSSSSRGWTPSGSSRASHALTSLRTNSRLFSGALAAKDCSAVNIIAASARGATRSSMPVIASAASRLTRPEARPVAIDGYLGSRRSPLNVSRVAVASPTPMSLDASRIEPPVADAINPWGDAKERCFARPSWPNSGRERRAT